MFRNLFYMLLLLWPAVPAGSASVTWGFFMHRHITRTAVFTLPPDMILFFKSNLPELVRMSVDPDRRRHLIPEEAARHYIDLDRYPAVDSIRDSWAVVSRRYSRDTLMAHGIVPWHIMRTCRALTNAFRLQDGRSILRLAADLSHYTGDAHVPLHASSNYDGQQTGQTGIHALWESRLPELFFERYDRFTGRAEYLFDPEAPIWEAVIESAILSDSVLLTEKRLHEELGEASSGGFDYRGRRLQRVYNQQFSRLYHQALRGMVEERFRASVRMTGNLWYTCWVNAGQPDLSRCRVNPGSGPDWKMRYDSLRRADSLRFAADPHLAGE